MLALHIILAIVSIVLSIFIFFKIKLKGDFTALELCSWVVVFSFSAALGSGVNHNYYYRDRNEPTIDDVNNDYAFIDQVIEADTTYLKIKWQGSNKRNEREINNLNKVNHHGFKVKR